MELVAAFRAISAEGLRLKSENARLTEQRDMLLGALQRAIPEIAVCCAADVLEQARAAIEAASKPQP
jgi:Fe2+ or Zn2+ uptake regulation protein